MSSQRNNNEMISDLDAIMKGDYGSPEVGDKNLNNDLETILGEPSGFGKYGGDYKSQASLKFDPKLSFPVIDKETQDLLDRSNQLYKSSTNTENDNNNFLKKLIEEGSNDHEQSNTEPHNEVLNMGIITF